MGEMEDLGGEVIFILAQSGVWGYVIKASIKYVDSKSVIWLYFELLLVVLFTYLFLR